MAITHACIATAGVSLLLSTSHPLPLVLAVLGSQLPDLDTTTSIIGQVLYPVSRWIEDRFPHRSITHSLVATGAIAALSLPIALYFGNWKAGAAVPLGHLLSCFSDCFTRQGVQLFWPDPAWAISVSNPRRRLRTGGPGEYWVLAAAVALLLVGIHVAGGGGVSVAVGQSIGLRETAISTYNAHPQNAVYADIKGVWADDRSRADGEYLILKADGSEFIVTDGSGIYHTGQSMVVESLKARAGEPMETQTETLSFADENPVERLQQLAISHPGKAIYLTGTLTVDYPEGITLQPPGRQYETAAIMGETLTLDLHPLELATVQLSDQWVVGRLAVSIGS
ncbi:metal-dependent hydrolase [Oscillatoria sp. CS-180]|uniref:metal-dependent hydrolase n=1 Tax=Oscillatoria sp. CS-180 TaxID=3021720 RepID=UPI00232E3488|nr:metal-dependent hydrolase [Oscillatoria sp. CS-180]MDB9529940.1 metal-dependent hydrolase [Oscillatoria sp. CS-180]